MSKKHDVKFYVKNDDNTFTCIIENRFRHFISRQMCYLRAIYHIREIVSNIYYVTCHANDFNVEKQEHCKTVVDVLNETKALIKAKKRD